MRNDPLIRLLLLFSAFLFIQMILYASVLYLEQKKTTAVLFNIVYLCSVVLSDQCPLDVFLTSGLSLLSFWRPVRPQGRPFLYTTQ